MAKRKMGKNREENEKDDRSGQTMVRRTGQVEAGKEEAGEGEK